jgi:hypothetical protein
MPTFRKLKEAARETRASQRLLKEAEADEAANEIASKSRCAQVIFAVLNEIAARKSHQDQEAKTGKLRSVKVHPQPQLRFVMTISIYRTDISPSSPTHIFIQSSQSRDKCIRYNPMQSYDYAPPLSFKPLLWMLLFVLVAFSVAAIVTGEALDYPLVRREGKPLVNVTANVDVLEEKNGTDDLLYIGGNDDDIIAEPGNGTGSDTGLHDSEQGSLDIMENGLSSHPTEIDVGMDSSDKEDSNGLDDTRSSNITKDNLSNVVEVAVNATIAGTATVLVQNTTTDLRVPLPLNYTSNVYNGSEQSIIFMHTDNRTNISEQPVKNSDIQYFERSNAMIKEPDQSRR